MKQFTLFFFIISLSLASCISATAMSSSKIRKDAHFLTDRMAHELRLTRGQYDDIYEINYDFINDVRYVVDDAMHGHSWALDRYYNALDDRNDDLRWVLSRDQYRRFMRMEHFYRPICSQRGKWVFRVYITYTNHSHFYFSKPHHYKTYSGAHCHKSRGNKHYYKGRYKHETYNSNDYRTSRKEVYSSNRRADFGITETRPGTERPTSGRPNTESNNSGRNPSDRRPTDKKESISTRPSNNTKDIPSRRPSTARPASTKESQSDKKNDKSDSDRGNGRGNGSTTRRSSSND